MSSAEPTTWGDLYNNDDDPDKVSNGKQAARKGFPRRSENQKSAPVNVSVRGERANFTRLVLGWLAGWYLGYIKAKFCK